jgi:hypothetical protein
MISAMRASFLASVLAPAFAIAVFAIPAASQTMDFACPEPGTTFTYDSGVSVVARGRDGMDCTMENVGGKPFKVRALLFSNPSSDGANISALIAALRPERLWPLKIGKKIDATYSAGGRSWNYTIEVARYEKRMGPGDALFDAFAIEMNELGSEGQRSITRWWLSPVEKFVIRYDWSDSNGKANRALITSIKR